MLQIESIDYILVNLFSSFSHYCLAIQIVKLKLKNE